MKQVKHNFKGTVTEMLIVISTIINAAITYEADLTAKRPKWKPPYFNDVLARINDVIKTYLGVNNAAELLAATKALLGIAKDARAALADLRTDIDVSYAKNKARRGELFSLLGYDKYMSSVHNNDQEALISLLYYFGKAMTKSLHTELVDALTTPGTIDDIFGYADVLRDADVAQEGLKGSKPNDTAEANTAYNDIYTEAIGIARIGYRQFREVPAKQQQFSYTHTLKMLNLQPKEERKAVEVK